MSEPPGKRRRTNSPDERASSPLRKPPRRPSFASPTKASLARNYPNLVPSRTIPGPRSPSQPNSRGETLSRGQQARAFILGETDIQEEGNVNATQQASPLAQSITPRAQRSAGAGRTRPLAYAVDEEEAELPATPSQQGLEEQDGPRRGVLFSSPSKRPPRAKGTVKQSPLRPKASTIEQVPALERAGEQDKEGAEEKELEREPPNSELEKRKQHKARLERELADLEAQVLRCTSEISKEQKRNFGDALSSSEQSDLIELLTDLFGAEDEAEKPLPVSSLLTSFLPFSTTKIPRPQTSLEERPILSHKPVELADPLPYLQMFTSFSFSTQLRLPASSLTHQEHIIDIVGPQKLLTAQISIVIDTVNTKIINMQILRLSAWAEQDLGRFLRTKAKRKDLSIACWAIEAYWAIATKRAQYWIKCESTFSHLIVGRGAEDTENPESQLKQSNKISRQALNRHLGRGTLILQDRHVLLKLDWRIDFDWTGEAESRVTVEPAFPNVWTESDTAKALKKVPGTFASLLQNKGAFEATRIMTKLLFAN